MACLSNFPESVKDIFVRREDTIGRYTLRLYDYMRKSVVDVVVDEYVPCHPQRWWDNEGKPLFARPNGNEMWCLLLEKAMAKLFGSYEGLDSNTSGVAFRALACESRVESWDKKRGKWRKETLKEGKDTWRKRLILQDKVLPNELFQMLQECDRENFMMSADINQSSVREFRREDGLVEGHAYALLHVLEVQGFRFVCLRNPWGGSIEWNGAWSDGDIKWRQYPNVSARIRPCFGDDGMFWMPFEDFERIYSSVVVCCKAMRTGPAAGHHLVASMQGQLPADVLNMIRDPGPASHPFVPIKEVLPSTAPALLRAYAGGTAVEYLTDQGQWVPCTVVRFNEQGLYDLTSAQNAPPDRVRQRAAGTAVATTSFPPGAHLEYWSDNKQQWFNVSVVRFDASTNLYDLDIKKGVPTDKLRQPQATKESKFTAGASVQYFSTSQHQWIPARILLVNESSNTYDLDCRSDVPPEKIRAVETLRFQVGQRVEYLGGTTWLTGMVLQYHPDTYTYDLDVQSDVPEVRIRAAEEDPVALGFSFGQRVEYHSQSRQAWIEATVVRYEPITNTYDLDIKQGVPVGSLRKVEAVVFPAGSAVEFYSISAQQWCPAMVVSYHPEQSLYDLDTRIGVPADRLRKPTGVAPQRVQCVAAISPGEAVEYFSSQHQWIAARVISFDLGTNTYNLDIKIGAPSTHVRRPGCVPAHVVGHVSGSDTYAEEIGNFNMAKQKLKEGLRKMSGENTPS
uniref:Calpain catalytic domain-containing protein n=1 Tax=Noctiluca scintillans TaxID=2966 RepID=A0A7S1ASL0_NOCSC